MKKMVYTFAVALDLSPIEIITISISVIAFLIMFGLSSVKGDYQGLISSTLAQDEKQRQKRSK